MIERIEKFKSLGLGLFIHYGLYSKFEKGEWFWEMNKLTENDYYSLVGKNYKLKCNFKKIIPTIKKSGFNYVVFTVKHHDGFALYDSNNKSKYDINWLINKKDIVESFINECQKNNMKAFLYYATMEWIKKPFKNQVKNIYDNVEYLLSKYGSKISGFWFDGNWSELNGDWKLDELYNLIRSNNKDCIIINNTGLEAKGVISHKEIDVVTFEQGKQNDDNTSLQWDKTFEVCYPINDHWGYANLDFNYKNFSSILLDYAEIRSKGGNLLLNVGLNKNGEIGDYEKAIINLFKKWNEINNFCLNGNIEVVSQNNKNLIFINNLSQNKHYILVKNLESGAHINNIHYGNILNKYNVNLELNKIFSIKLLDNNKSITFIQNKKNLELEINSFEYGTNELIRIMEIIYDE